MFLYLNKFGTSHFKKLRKNFFSHLWFLWVFNSPYTRSGFLNFDPIKYKGCILAWVRDGSCTMNFFNSWVRHKLVLWVELHICVALHCMHKQINVNIHFRTHNYLNTTSPLIVCMHVYTHIHICINLKFRILDKNSDWICISINKDSILSLWSWNNLIANRKKLNNLLFLMNEEIALKSLTLLLPWLYASTRTKLGSIRNF